MIRLAIILVMIVLAGSADAQWLLGVTQPTGAGGTFTPPSCNNSLDFSQACNSVYWGLVL